MTFLDNIVTFAVLLGLFVIGYCKMTKQTVGDMIRSIREAIANPVEEIQGGVVNLPR